MRPVDSAEYKNLESQLKAIEMNIILYNRELAELRDKTQRENNKKNRILDRLKELKERYEDNIIVTEHARIRYIERVIGVDNKELEDYILTPKVRALIKQIKTGEITIAEEVPKPFTLVIKDNVVVTVRNAS